MINTSYEPLVSIIILTNAPGAVFTKLLDAIGQQRFSGGKEVIVIDSGEDNRLEGLVKERGFYYKRIEPEDFSHGGTRNLGVKEARGRYIVFITQDALPVNKDWLQALISPMENDPVLAGVYSKQVPHETTHPMEKYFLTVTYGDDRRINSSLGKEVILFDDVFFSNVSSAIRRDILVSYPFDETLVMSEDQEWSKRVIEAGLKTLYEPMSKVFHSHHYTAAEVFKRNFDSGASLRRIFKSMPGGILKNIKILIGLVSYLYGHGKIYMIPLALLYECVKTIGFICGWNERHIPVAAKPYLGAHKMFWKNSTGGWHPVNKDIN